MAGSSFGTIFKLSTFGESHGTAMGGVIDGCPAGVSLDLDEIQADLDRRRPGQNDLVTQRKEEMSFGSCRVFLKARPLELPLDLRFKIKTKNQRIIHI